MSHDGSRRHVTLASRDDSRCHMTRVSWNASGGHVTPVVLTRGCLVPLGAPQDRIYEGKDGRELGASFSSGHLNPETNGSTVGDS
eukprot:scaffold46339_cov49-Phaeocystis_antarctica.AAC.1